MAQPKKLELVEDVSHQGWHIDKRLTVGHIVTTIVVAISASMYVGAMERRISVLETKQELTLAHQKEAYRHITDQLLRIEAKLDSKADKTR